ncbi:S8 family serine peptidase [Paraflavitalea speifideaquila]|uniref:S8 family serine peptidase n=1 Tax=Paraflavitalea speifideaquila TaxID=3076558 RepID=UPI0028E93465|nr:S8 family serine peptidase [Paraflavitalea speifideiaquila]
MIKPVKVTGLAVALVLTGFVSQAQQDNHTQPEELPKGWHLLDKEKDGFYGISVDKAYEFIKTKKLKGKTVVVAVIDSGIDTLHEDLKEILWKNPKEIPGNGIDDDGNGYVDDVYGWNFIGNKDGRNLKQDSYEGARVYHKLKPKYDNKKIDPATLKGEELAEYTIWLKAKSRIEGGDGEPQIDLLLLKRLLKGAKKAIAFCRLHSTKILTQVMTSTA